MVEFMQYSICLGADIDYSCSFLLELDRSDTTFTAGLRAMIHFLATLMQSYITLDISACW